jgi:predicted nucleic acid-binding protein
MITYADTSVLVAWFHPDDEFARPVTEWVRENVADFVWNPVLRLELRHNLRKLHSTYARAAWTAFRAAERSRLRLGRDKLHDLIEEADELSAKHAATVPAGAWDFFHVAAAIRQRAAAFATCDKLQAELAMELKLPRIKLFAV